MWVFHNFYPFLGKKKTSKILISYKVAFYFDVAAVCKMSNRFMMSLKSGTTNWQKMTIFIYCLTCTSVCHIVLRTKIFAHLIWFGSCRQYRLRKEIESQSIASLVNTFNEKFQNVNKLIMSEAQKILNPKTWNWNFRLWHLTNYLHNK